MGTDIQNTTSKKHETLPTARMSILEVLTEAERLKSCGQHLCVIALYQEWLEHNTSALAHAVWFNLGVELSNQNQAEAGVKAYETAIQLDEYFAPARFNLGTQLEKKGSPKEALAEWKKIIQYHKKGLLTNTDRDVIILTFNNIGRLLEIMREYHDAEAMLVQSLQLDPHQPDVIQHLLHLRQKKCAWPICKTQPEMPTLQWTESASALSTLAMTDSVQEQLLSARRFISKKVFPASEYLSQKHGYQHKKLRIGYLSSDFCLHPVGLLTAELFALHDRNQFEVHAFCWSREDGSALRKRILTSMDRVMNIAKMDDEAAARTIRAQEIDILIDLHGLTSGARPNILSWRPAPVQISYLGFPGTTGHPEVDYIIVDNYILPEENEKYYSEKPLRTHHCFQICDRKRDVSNLMTREECGLPKDAFIFCCFNNNYKITEPIFSSWMRILQRTPNAVLWLLADNPWAQENLIAAARKHGINSQRLIFAERVAPATYLSRYRLADLFLDTFPFNAGATANDALWMGLPLLTLSGQSFASRMGGSLLRALDLTDLIATTLEHYERIAIELAASPTRIKALQEQLKTKHTHAPVFDTPSQVRELERLFQHAYETTVSMPPTSGQSPYAATQHREIKSFLHVGCGTTHKQQTIPFFNTDSWRELRQDINPATRPDILGSMTNLSALPSASVDAIYSSHNLEHLFPHEVPLALEEFRRVLKPDGFVVITCPDLQSVCALVAANKLGEPAYLSTMGPITPLDILYGHQASLATGNMQMAHHCGFTRDTLTLALQKAGFGSVSVLARPNDFDLWAFASSAALNASEFTALAEQVLGLDKTIETTMSPDVSR